MEKICKSCARLFKTPRRSRKYCSQSCYWKEKKKSFNPLQIEMMRNATRGKPLSREHIQKILEVKREKRSLRSSDELAEIQARKKYTKIYYTLVGRARGWKKEDKTIVELGYSPREFRKEMEGKFLPGMTWANHGRGRGKWHVDHIKPISSFPIGTSPKVVNALNNLQPLWEEENLSKGKRT